MPVDRDVEENGLAAILATKRSAGVTQEVNLRKCVTHMPPISVNKSDQSGFEPRGDVIRSPEQGYQWSHKKKLCPPKAYKKELDYDCVNVKVH